MRFREILFISSLSALWMTSCAGDSPSLKIGKSSAPLSIEVTSPKELTVLGVGEPKKWVGCGYSIQWGDNSYSPTPHTLCVDGLKHIYKNPGTYTVKAQIWHPGPDDAPVTDWSDSVVVHVSR